MRFLLVALLLAGCTSAPAEPTGQLDGALVDQMLNPFPASEVYLENLVDITSELGGFTFQDIPPGKYLVHANPEGAAPTEQEVIIRAGETTRVILQSARPAEPRVEDAHLESTTRSLALPGDWCDVCTWTTTLHQVPEKVTLRASWDTEGTLQVVLRERGGATLVDVMNGDEIWVPVAGEAFRPDHLELQVAVRFVDIVPRPGVEVRTSLDIEY